MWPAPRLCARCGQPVTSSAAEPHDTVNEGGVWRAVSIIVTNEPCGHALITTPDKQADALQRPA
jgi:hypothetical protein